MTEPIFVVDQERYFSPSHFETLRDLAREICHIITMPSFDLSYDPKQDFHHLAFNHDGTKVDVRYYRVFSYLIDGEEGWVGCPVYNISKFALSIARNLRERKPK